MQDTAAWLLGVPFALALGIVGGLLGLIPQVGATLAAVISACGTPCVSATSGSIGILCQQLENYVLQPTIQGRAAEISGS